jgi:hypothetical protein
MRCTFKIILVLLSASDIFFGCKQNEEGQNPEYSKEIENKIKLVESNLQGGVQIDGDTADMSL